MSLDTTTLLTVATFVTGLLGVFILMCWVQERGTRALAWWGAAYLLGGSAVGLWNASDLSAPHLPPAPNALLFIACGMIWNGARLFHGRDIHTVGLFAGALAWVGATQVTQFDESGSCRIVFSSVVIAIYAFLTAFELGRERRHALPKPWFSSMLPLLHGVVFLSPIPLTLLAPQSAPLDGWIPLFALQTLLYVIGTAFIVIIMSKERTALCHKTDAMTDPLTGVHNRRGFFEIGHQLMQRLGRTDGAVSVLAFDLDQFKAINDRFGHAVGDDVLQLFAVTARNNTRATDVLGRLGGEEFAVIMPGGAAEALMVGERLRAAFASAAGVVSGRCLDATVSIGAVTARAPADIIAMLHRADDALYEAKAGGRNRIVLAPESPEYGASVIGPGPERTAQTALAR